MPIKFQWSFGEHWIDFSTENNAILEERRNIPQMEPLFIKNSFGEIWGVPERDDIKFRIHGDDTIVTCHIRQAPNIDELPMWAILNPSGPLILDYDTSRALFNDDGSVRTSTEPIHYGTEIFQAVGGALFQVINGLKIAKRYRPVEVTKGQYEDMTRARFRWKFKGPFRWSRMSLAVQNVLKNTEDVDKRSDLQAIFDGFNPSEDNTEYGPIQFPDYLHSIGMSDVAFQVAEAFKKIPVNNDWTYFDPITNVRIEEARRQERPVIIVEAEGQKYMIVFDIGTGASGNSSVIIRPTRYQKIIDSIEEQFQEASEEHHKRILHELFELLAGNNINPKLFVMAMVTNEQAALNRLISDHELRASAQSILQRLHASDGNLSTRMQQFMPALLEKFKECDITMDEHENLNPKQLCPKILATLQEGLSVPESDSSFGEMIQFIQKEQSWKLPKGDMDCDICGQPGLQTLTHCGSASACLKCWVDSLVKTNMSCPFCRGTIGEGDLKMAKANPKPDQKVSRKRKRNTVPQKRKPEDILSEIHKDEKYTNISMDSKEPMRKWFTILLRRKLVRIGQMPRNGQGKKDFVEAMKIFKLLP